MVVTVGGSATISPGSLSAAELIRAVLDYVQGSNDAELRDSARRELNMAIDEVNCRNWRRLLATQTITLVAGDDSYEVDSTFREPYRAVLYSGTSRRLRLTYIPLQTFLDEYSDGTLSSQPGCYTIDHENRSLILEEGAGTSLLSIYDTIQLTGYKRLSYLVQDSDMHGGVPEFNAFLIWQARSGVAAIRGEDSLSMRAEAKARHIFRCLCVDDAAAATDWE